MKIGILTFHCAHNFGAVLQCYALQEALKEMGHEVFIIDYRPDYLINPYKVFSFQRIKSKNPIKIIVKLIIELLSIKARIIKDKGFCKFINTLFNLYPITQLSNQSDFDLFVFGSDQIWNPKFNNNKLDPIFLGSSPIFSHTPKIAYAASMGCKKLADPKQESKFIQGIQTFKSISVREKSLQEYIFKVSGIKSKIVVDPTLLLSSIQYEKLIGERKIKENYIFIYQVGRSEHLTKNLDYLEKKSKKKIINISACGRIYLNQINELKYTPYDFLNLIKYADLILTTSFHGTVFSCIFQKNFYTFSVNENVDDRSKNLLKSLSLEERMIDNVSKIKDLPINYNLVNPILKNIQTESLIWLKKSIKISNNKNSD